VECPLWRVDFARALKFSNGALKTGQVIAACVKVLKMKRIKL